MNLFKELHALRIAITENKNIFLEWQIYNPEYFIKNPKFTNRDFKELVFDKIFTINHLIHFKAGILNCILPFKIY
jgi:hypothetical protein